MYNENYDEYIRSILGYPMNNSYNNSYQSYNNQNQSLMNSELDKCYPEIYKIVYPMIRTKCDNFRGNVNNEEIENMTDEIYYALDSDVSKTIEKTVEKKVDTKVNEKTVENRQTRQINRNLRDLIKILLIRELLNRPGRPQFPPRPPMPGPGPRPPMRPPFGPGGPIFNRDFEANNYDIYEY